MKDWWPMHLLMIPVLVFALGQEPNQAEKVFRTAEKKLAEADTVQIAFDVAAQVWLDSETNLPLKRVVNMKERDEKLEVTETYDIRINTKIDPKMFELPK